MRATRHYPKITLPIASVLVVAALVWWEFAVPALVKYPTNLDVTARYAGTFTLFADPKTGQPLATPRSAPLEIDRHIRSLGDQSGSSRVVVEETIKEEAGDLLNTIQTNVYVMDRRTMRNVVDSRAYAFEASNVVDRSGTYRLNLPFNTKANSTYEIYKNEIGRPYELHRDTKTAVTDEAGLRLRNFAASVTDVPIDPAYRAQLDKLAPLPESMTLDQLKPQLRAAGLDVDAVLRAVAPVITPRDLATLGRLTAKPIPLQYVFSFRGRAAVEPSTGAEVDVAATESVGAKPVLADVDALHDVIARYPNVPEAVDAGRALERLTSAAATKLFEVHYEQTRASVAEIAGHVKAMRYQMRLAELYVPLGLLSAAALSLVIGAVVSSRRESDSTIALRAARQSSESAIEREPESIGSSR